MNVGQVGNRFSTMNVCHSMSGAVCLYLSVYGKNKPTDSVGRSESFIELFESEPVAGICECGQ